MKDFPKTIDSKYKFVTVAAKRCELLQKGARPKIETENMRKFSTIAMQEVLDGLIEFDDTVEATPEEGKESA